MAFQLSPGVLVQERDLTNIIPAVSTSTGAFAGVFPWGPVLDPLTISSENQLVSLFGKPQNSNATSFFSAANYLAYTNNLILTRVNTADQRNAVATLSGSVTSVTITAGGTGYTTPTVTFSAPQISGGVTATGTVVVGSGIITAVTITNPGSGYTTAPTATLGNVAGGTGGVLTPVITTGGIKINNENDYIANYINGAGVVGIWAAKYPGVLGNSIKVSMADSATYATWTYKDEFDGAPSSSSYALAAGGSNDELHVIIIDNDGQISGTSGTILEKFAFVSKGSDSKLADGTNNYYKDTINTNSKYIWWMDHHTGVGAGTAWGSVVQNATFASLTVASTVTLSGGVDDFSASDAEIQAAYNLYANGELFDISLIITGAVTPATSKWIIENVAETRKDCIAFVSPSTATGGVITGLDILTDTISFRTAVSFNTNSSYGVLDSGWKYQYDRYNDVYRWIPLNADVAGLCARTDDTNDPWWSPGGLNRGQIKNVIKLSFNPTKTDRDNLYKNGINPVVSFPGQGTVLFGDKTLLSKPSAFDRINVRRLFIVLEKAIATAARYQLFEFNDSLTRAQFRSMVEPFLRDVQGRRGIIDFRVVADETNNTAEVIDRNEFVANIFIKPARSINFITLTFTAVRSGIAFEEVGG